jgi:hypothetical protein
MPVVDHGIELGIFLQAQAYGPKQEGKEGTTLPCLPLLPEPGPQIGDIEFQQGIGVVPPFHQLEAVHGQAAELGGSGCGHW